MLRSLPGPRRWWQYRDARAFYRMWAFRIWNARKAKESVGVLVLEYREAEQKLNTVMGERLRANRGDVTPLEAMIAEAQREVV